MSLNKYAAAALACSIGLRQMVFVYGTLKRGQRNHGLLEKAEYLGPDQTAGSDWLMTTNGSYPSVSPASSAGVQVHGELYAVDQTTLAAMDRLEAYRELYGREQVRLASGATAWMYTRQANAVQTEWTVDDGNWRGER